MPLPGVRNDPTPEHYNCMLFAGRFRAACPFLSAGVVCTFCILFYEKCEIVDFFTISTHL